MNVSLSRRRSDTDGDILDSPTETAHRVTFEMGQHYGKVIFRVRLSHKIFFQMLSPFHGQRYFSVRIHDDYRGYGRKAVVFGRFQMLFRIGTSAAVGRIALHDSAVHLLHQPFYQCRIEVIVISGFAGGKLHRHFSGSLPPERFIHFHQTLRTDFFYHIHFGRYFFRPCLTSSPLSLHTGSPQGKTCPRANRE